MQHFQILPLIFFLFLTEYSFSAQNTKLLFVQIVFRHGDRSPTQLYKNDPNPESVWPEGLGKLTKLGKEQHYALGKYFHNRYKNFSTFNPLEVEVTSSEDDRCIKSAEANLASFFHPSSNFSDNGTFMGQPIPIHYLPKEKDKYLEVDSYCPRAHTESKRIEKTPEVQHFIDEYKEMFESLSRLSGETIENDIDASYLQDTIFIEKKYNLTVPTWVDPYWDKMTNVTNWSFFYAFDSPLMQRLRAGPLLKKIIKNMKKSIAGKLKDRKFNVYSTHDENLVVVLNAMGLYNFIQPPYCATLLLELHEMSDNQKAVRLLYLNSTAPEEKIEEPHVLVLDGCEEYCSLNDFVAYVEDKLPYQSLYGS